jgi:glycosyltransferase involved in cell wall biosynthesis
MRIALHVPRPDFLQPGFSGDHFIVPAIRSGLTERGHEIEVISDLNVRKLWKGSIPARSLVTEAIAVRKRVKAFRPDAWLIYNPSAGHPDVFGWWQRPGRYLLLNASTHQSKRMRRRWRPFLSWCHRRSLQRADVVMAARRKTAERLRRRGAPAARLLVVPPAVAARRSIPTQRAARQRLALHPDEPLVLCVSRFTELGSSQRKTEIVLQLLQIVASLREKPLLVVVGDGPGRAAVEGAASRIHPEGRVRVFPAVSNEELVWFYAACDLYAYPDLVDLPRLSVLEAQACGRPVLTMRTASSEVTVADGRTGMLARDLTEFRARLRELVVDRARREAMGQAARAYVAAHHSIEVRARQVELLLQQPNAGRVPLINSVVRQQHHTQA